MAHVPQRPPQRPQQQRPQQQRPQAQHGHDPLREPEQERRFEDPLREHRADDAQASIYEPQAPDEPVRTIADEQRERSAEIEAMGVEAWKAAHDERSQEEEQHQVPGVSPTQIADDDRRSRSR
jgi:hypothetical protein